MSCVSTDTKSTFSTTKSTRWESIIAARIACAASMHSRRDPGTTTVTHARVADIAVELDALRLECQPRFRNIGNAQGNVRRVRSRELRPDSFHVQQVHADVLTEL